MRRLNVAFILITVACLQVSARGFSQNVTFSEKDASIEKVFAAIKAQTGYTFWYNLELVEKAKKVSIDIRNKPLKEALDICFSNQPFTYEIIGKTIVVKEKANTTPPATVPVEKPLPPLNIDVHGKIVNEEGAPLIGVSVTVSGSTAGTSTGPDGTYSISAPENGVLVFSYVGYTSQIVNVGSKTTIDIKMEKEVSALSDIVVVGYGTQKRGDLTGAIATVKGPELAKQPVVVPTQALQGKVAGVQIISSGQPNSLPTVRIRGTGSMLAGANPLYVVDGIITDDIRNINSADIVSLDVLKDASATAIYGMRAANGVLIITTKKGRVGKLIVSYDGSIGIKEASHLVNMAGPNQYANYINEASIYYGTGDSLITASKLAAGTNTDWYDAILVKGFWQNHNVSLSGGSEKINYFLSAGYITDQGIVETNDFKRFTLRSNNEYKLSNAIKLSTLISYSRANSRDIDLGVFNNAYRAAPYVPAQIGELYGNTSLSNNVGNPLLALNKNYSGGIDNRLQSTIAIDIKPVKWITFHSSFGNDLDFYNNTAYAYKFANTGSNSVFIEQGGNEVRPKSSLNVARNNTVHWVWDNTLTAVKSFGEHNFTLMVGTTAEEYTFNSLTGSRTDVPEDKNEWYLATGTTSSVNNDNTGDKYHRNSYIGRLNYNFEERYLLTATIRADGTSKFSSNNHWGYFPSIGVGWNISRESFMSSQKVFDNLKLRASYGEVGNDQIPSNTYLNLASINVPYFFGATPVYGISFDQLPDPNVRWEVTKEYDFGLDFALLNNRLSGEVDYYSKKVNDALININIPGTLPDADSKYTTNAASFENRGVEVTLNWKDKVGKDFSYNIGANISLNSNKITGLSGGQALQDGGNSQGFTTRSDNGERIGSFYLLQENGVFKDSAQIAGSAQPNAKPGDLRYEDFSGPNGKPDGKIDDFDRAFSGSYQPKIIFGINGGINYKEFDFSFGAYGTQGSKIFNGKKQSIGSDPRDNIETKVANGRWTPNNPNSDIPRANLTKLPNSTYFLENGNFLRINNLTIGYTLAENFLSKYKIQKLRLYATVQNLATFTKYSGFTPEIAGSNPLNAGIDLNAYPSVRTWAFGINLSF